jgi:hypothetical protein
VPSPCRQVGAGALSRCALATSYGQEGKVGVWVAVVDRSDHLGVVALRFGHPDEDQHDEA